MNSRPHFLLEALEYRRLLDGLSDDAGGPLELCEVHPAQLASSDVSDSQPASIYLASVLDQETLPSSDYSVTIDWGDGTVSAGRVVAAPDGALPRVFGDHEYASTGTYDLIITVTRDGIDASTATTFVQVFDADPMTEMISAPGDPWIVMSNQQVDLMPGAVVEMSGTSLNDPATSAHLVRYSPASFASAENTGISSVAVGLFQEDRHITELD